jgi:hypothetical protein
VTSEVNQSFNPDVPARLIDVTGGAVDPESKIVSCGGAFSDPSKEGADTTAGAINNRARVSASPAASRHNFFSVIIKEPLQVAITTLN